MSNKTIWLPETIINPHCHGRDIKEADKTTIEQVLYESQQAHISITCFEPNTQPPITNFKILDFYELIILCAKKRLGLTYDQYLYFGVTDNNLDQCETALKNPLVVGLKIYPKSKDGKSVTTGTIGVSKDNTILGAMKISEKADKVVEVHCDDPEIIKQDEGNTIRAETEYVKKIIRLGAQVPGVKILIPHVSCRESAELILAARQQGILIAAELCPQYLWFDDDGSNWNFAFDPIFYKCYNNLRGRDHREFLIDFMKKYYKMVIISSDSACHKYEEKLELGLGGIPSHQEMVPVIVTLAVELGLTKKQIASLLSFNASSWLGIPVSHNLIEYRLEERKVIAEYNHGIVGNPWKGSKLLFPVPIQ